MTDSDRLFRISSEDEFRSLALETFRFQARCCLPYAQYIGLLGIDPDQVTEMEQIPFLPIEVFKNREVYAAGTPPEIVFTSSGTTADLQSRHLVKDVSMYRKSFTQGFRYFYGDPAGYAIFALLPSYLEREGSSLIYMVDSLIRQAGCGGFYLHQTDQLLADIQRTPADRKPLLLGVTFALLEWAEKQRTDLSGAVVMETGGMKGRRRELPREELHAFLCERFNTATVHSEYGMCECLSQAYSAGAGMFYTPPWMRVLVRDLYDPFEYAEPGKTGAVNVIDLANYWSCSFIQTQDLGRIEKDGGFQILGRMDNSEIRGCNLLVAE